MVRATRDDLISGVVLGDALLRLYNGVVIATEYQPAVSSSSPSFGTDLHCVSSFLRHHNGRASILIGITPLSVIGHLLAGGGD